MTPHAFHDAVHAFCVRLGASETSGFRTVAHNLKVGGVPQSAHQYRLGRDVVYDAPVHQALAQDTASRLGLRLVREGDHDHLQPLDWRAG